jgi:DNA-binding LytR/AlgR family response regulator
MNVLICDDDQYVRKMLEKITSENKLVSNIFVVEDGLEAVKVAGNKKIDIALLDIDMPNLDGIEAARIISTVYPEVRIVFITAYMEYAVDSFCVHPYDYLLKPIDISKFKEVLNELLLIVPRYIKSKDNEVNKLTIKEGNQIYIISFDDIIYLEKNNREVLVHTTKEIFTLNKTLTDLESNFLNKNFIRTHQSFIVNKTKIKRIRLIGNKSYEIEFTATKNKASLSRHRYDALMKSLSNG